MRMRNINGELVKMTDEAYEAKMTIEEKRIPVHFGEMVKDEDGFPSMPIVDDDGCIYGWLHPFRGYCFQISGTQDGDTDYGASPITPDGFRIKTTARRAFLRASVDSAIYQFMIRSSYGQDVYLRYSYGYDWDTFLSACEKWIDSINWNR